MRERDRQDEDARAEREFEVWPDMAPAVLTFMSMGTQWKYGFLGNRLGLDYAMVQPVAAMLEVSLDSRAFIDIQIMERAAMAELGKRKHG